MLSATAALAVAVVVLLALVVLGLRCAALLLQQPLPGDAWRSGVSAVVVTGVWWLLNGPVEGPTLVALSRTHGVTVADVVGAPTLLVGAAVLALAVRG